MNEIKEVTVYCDDKSTRGRKILPDGRVFEYTISQPPIKVGDVLRNGATVLYIQDCDPDRPKVVGRSWAVIAYRSDIPRVLTLKEAQALCAV